MKRFSSIAIPVLLVARLPRPGRRKKSCAGIMTAFSIFVVIVTFPAVSWSTEAARPNLVLIIADDMGYSDTGAFGCSDIRTPNIDRLAAAGTVFTNAYVTGPICVPSRMGILTGRYQQRWGVYGNGDGYTPSGLKGTSEEITIAELLQEAGYATALIGKWHLSGNGAILKSIPESLPERNGFDEVAVIPGGMSHYNAGAALYCGDGRMEKAPEYLTDHFGKLSAEFIERMQTKPFFLCLAFNAVHAPLQAPSEDVEAYDEISVLDRRTYAGMVSALDRNVGRVLDAIDAAGAEQNTIVAFLSDNGGPAPDAPRHSRNMACNGPLRGYKFDVFEGGIRTPMILKWPGKVPAGQRFSGLSSSMDLSATFLATVGRAPHDRPLDGTDLLPYLDGRKSGPPHDCLFWECNWFGTSDCAARRGNWKIVQLRAGPESPGTKQWQLFDLDDDVGEQTDVAKRHPQIVKELETAYRTWRSKMAKPCTPLKPAPVHSDVGTPRRPNVILLLTDDQGYGDLSCHGNPVLKTPNMDALATQGIRLSDFHVSPLCSPTRAALMTGRHCRKVGVHGTNGTDQHMATEAVTMAELFAAGGYVTGIFGKWHLGDHYPLRPMDRGFAESVVFPDGAVSTIPDYWGNDYFDDTYLHQGEPQQYEGYCTDVWFELALRFIETNKDRPFFCYLPTNAAHAPYLVPEQYLVPYRNDPRVPNAAFYGMIANIDDNLGRLRKRLVQLGLDRDTILIFMGDNGTAGGGYHAGMRGRKASPYDGGHRTACFIYYPAGGLTGGRAIDQLSAHVDILPTLADFCRLDCRRQESLFDGLSLKPALLGTGDQHRDRVLIESFRGVVMTKRWRLVNERELYDIVKDPGQRHNVAKQFPEVVLQLTQELKEYRKTEDLRPHEILVGADQHNPVTLTGEDWKAKPLIYQNWVSLLREYDPQSMWNVRISQPGRYRLALRRWPQETGTGINAVLPKEKWCYGMMRCVPLHAVESRIRVGNTEMGRPVTDTMQQAEFTLDLPAGSTTIQGWFIDRDERLWSAPYLEVQKLRGDEQ